MTHADLVERAKVWLQNTRNCRIVVTEFVSDAWEYPDAMGFGPGSNSILIECKTSRADFLAERKKPQRQNPEMGLGRFRYYLTPQGLLLPAEIQDGWGLLEVRDSRSIRVAKEAEHQTKIGDAEEKAVLISGAWRALRALSLVKPIHLGDCEQPLDVDAVVWSKR